MVHSVSILGCGWLGLPLGAHLVQSGFKVKGSTTRPEKLDTLKEAKIHPYLLEVKPGKPLADGSFFDVDVLIINIPPRNKDGISDYHHQQLLAVRKAALEGGIKHILFVSSTGVYPNLNRRVTESDASEAQHSRGGVPLLKMEQVFKDFSGFTSTVVRFGGLYGGDRHPGRFLAGKEHVAGADSPVNMIHREDCISIIKKIIDHQVWGETFNACAPSHPDRRSFYIKAAADLELQPPSFSDKKKDYKIVSSEKLIERINYTFQVLP